MFLRKYRKVVHLRHVTDYESNLSNCDKNAFRVNLALVTPKHIYRPYDNRTFRLTFNRIIRPHLGCRSTVFSPLLQKDKDTLKCIQRLATNSNSVIMESTTNHWTVAH